MNYLFNFLLRIIDFFYQKKIINFFKKNISPNIEVLLDVGSHNGETIKFFLKNFNVENVYSFEASTFNYEILVKNVKKMQKKYNNCNINIFNIGIGIHQHLIKLIKILYTLKESTKFYHFFLKKIFLQKKT